MGALFSKNKWIFKDLSELNDEQHILKHKLSVPGGIFEEFQNWLSHNPNELGDKDSASTRVPIIDDESTRKRPINIWSTPFLKNGLTFSRFKAIYSNQSLARLPVFIQLYHLLFSFVNGAQAGIVPIQSLSTPKTRKSPQNALITGIHQYFGELYGVELTNLKQDTFFGLIYNLADQQIQDRVFSENFIQLYQVCHHLRTGLQIIDLKTVSSEDTFTEMHLPPLLICLLGSSMSEKNFVFLRNYAKNGGFIWFIGPSPLLNKNGKNSNHGSSYVNIIPQHVFQLSSKKRPIIKFYPYGMGGYLYSWHNPYRIVKGFLFYLHQFLTKSIQFVQSKWLSQVKNYQPSIYGLSNQLLDYLNEMDWFLPVLHRSSIKSTNLILRFLQNHRIFRKVDLSFRTEYIYRHKVDIYVFHHLKKDILHIFLFSKQVLRTLPISLRLYRPDNNSSTRIRTHLLGQTAQFLRIENGELTALYYTGINPLTFAHVPLAIKVNRKNLSMNHSLDIILLSRTLDKKKEYIFYTANGTQREQIILTGLFADPIVLPANGSVSFFQELR